MTIAALLELLALLLVVAAVALATGLVWPCLLVAAAGFVYASRYWGWTRR